MFYVALYEGFLVAYQMATKDEPGHVIKTNRITEAKVFDNYIKATIAGRAAASMTHAREQFFVVLQA